MGGGRVIRHLEAKEISWKVVFFFFLRIKVKGEFLLSVVEEGKKKPQHVPLGRKKKLKLKIRSMVYNFLVRIWIRVNFAISLFFAK